jgi:hypothetical protein
MKLKQGQAIEEIGKNGPAQEIQICGRFHFEFEPVVKDSTASASIYQQTDLF